MKNTKLLEFTKKFSFVLFANIFSTFISALVTLVVPKIISVEQYGYYQMYLFYINYVGVSFLGWCDGIYLRIGGKQYHELEKPLYCTQFWLLGLYEAILYVAIFVIMQFFSTSTEMTFVIASICLSAVGICLRYFIIFILQATARIKEYAVVTIVEKIWFVILVTIFMLAGHRTFGLVIGVDIVAKFISLAIGGWYCRDIIFSRLISIRQVYKEIFKNISVGIRLMLASLCSLLIIGIVRLGMQNHWDIETFGKVSLTLNISNMVMTAINAIAIVIYPILKRTSNDYLLDIYKVMRSVLMCLVFGALVFYYPVQKILTAWLPQYAESLRYAAILFPICVYESKISLLINTYYKTLRLENLLMKCNIISLVMSALCTAISIYIFDNMILAVLSILFVLIFRCVLCEIQLSKHIAIIVWKDTLFELTMTATFIIFNWFFGLFGMFMYAFCYFIYLIIKRKDILESLNFIKSMR